MKDENQLVSKVLALCILTIALLLCFLCPPNAAPKKTESAPAIKHTHHFHGANSKCTVDHLE